MEVLQSENCKLFVNKNDNRFLLAIFISNKIKNVRAKVGGGREGEGRRAGKRHRRNTGQCPEHHKPNQTNNQYFNRTLRINTKPTQIKMNNKGNIYDTDLSSHRFITSTSHK